MEEKIGIDHIICKVCGEKVERVYGAHLKKHGLSSKEYKDMFPGEPLTTKKDKEKTSKNSGQHMKQEKYKKMFSEKIKGSKNPNHKSKTTEEERKERSPFSKDFLKYNSEDDLRRFRKDALEDRKHTTRLDYYLEQGYDLETSEKMLKERQSTFSKEICIEKYGKEKGIKIFTKRQEHWQLSLTNNGNMKQGYSKISQDLFYDILENYNYERKIDIFFATKNNEIRLEKDNGGIWIYDFCDLNSKKIIEYNGDEYHGNPKKYKSSDTPHPFRKNITAQEIWNKDSEKKRIAEQEGFDVLIIWDSEYKKNKDKTIKKCLDFLEIK
jgi:hypothetical protein